MRKKILPGKKVNFTKSLILYFLLSLLLTIILYKEGHFYGGGDIGLPLINPKKSFQITQYSWWGGQATGFTYPGVLSSALFYFLFGLLQNFLAPILLQAVFFFFIFFFSFLGSYFFYQSLVKTKKIAVLASLFYVVNPYMLFVVWHRFTHTTFVMMACLPWSLLFLKLLLEKRKLLYLISFILTTLLLAYAFGTPALLVTWWFVIISYFVFHLLYKANSLKKRIQSLYLFFLILVFWTAFNLWWLMPFSQTATSTLLSTTSSSGNVESLRGVSQYFTMEYALRGINSFYLFVQKDWGEFYRLVPIRILSWFGFAICIIGLIKKTTLTGLKSLFLFFVLSSLFVSKGSSPPLGEINVSLHSLIPQMAVFRNPFEKFGIVGVVGFAYFFAIGADWFSKKYARPFFLKLIFYVFLLLFVFLFHWPFWTGNLFGSIKEKPYAAVPDSYWQAGEYIDKKFGKDVRILHLPLALGDGIRYSSWEYPYQGLEPSQAFFSGSSISHLLGYSELDQILQLIALSVKTNDSKMFNLLLDKFAVDVIVLHKDVDYNFYAKDSYENISNFLNTKDRLKLTKDFGELIIFEVTNPQSRFTIDEDLIKLSGNKIYFDHDIYRYLNSKNFYYNDSLQEPDLSNKLIILPSFVSNFPKVKVHAENAFAELPYVKYSPDSPFYSFVRIKEALVKLPMTEREKFDRNIDLLGKRLVEAKIMLDKGDDTGFQKAREEYIDFSNKLLPKIKERFNNILVSNDSTAMEILKAQLDRQRIVVERTKQLRENSAIRKFFEHIEHIGLASEYEGQHGERSLIFGFYSPVGEEYSVIFDDESWPGKTDRRQFFEKGMNIFAEDIDGRNYLSQFRGERELNSMRPGDKAFFYELDNPDADSTYFFSIEYKVIHGSEPSLKIYQDINKEGKNGEKIPSLLREAKEDPYAKDWRLISGQIKPSPFASKVIIEVSVDNWNNCIDINNKKKYLCEDLEYKNQFDRETKVILRNPVLTRSPLASVYLSAVNQPALNETSEQRIDYTKVNDTLYATKKEVAIKNQFLIFRETFNDGWRLLDESGNEIDIEKHVLVNNYANGWLIEDYHGKIYIEFVPQNKRKLGIYYGLAIALFGALITIYGKNKKIIH